MRQDGFVNIPNRFRNLLGSRSAGSAIRPKTHGMRLETEGGLGLPDPPWHRVETALRQLDAGFGNSYASLSLGHANYVQTLRGINGFHLEWRITGDDVDEFLHYRAANPGGTCDLVRLRKHDAWNDGQLRDLLVLDQVIEAFRCFFDRKAPPQSLHWRTIDV